MSSKSKAQCYEITLVVTDVRVIGKNGVTEVKITLSRDEIQRVYDIISDAETN